MLSELWALSFNLITLGKNNLPVFTESVAFCLKVFNCAFSAADCWYQQRTAMNEFVFESHVVLYI